MFVFFAGVIVHTQGYQISAVLFVSIHYATASTVIMLQAAFSALFVCQLFFNMDPSKTL